MIRIACAALCFALSLGAAAQGYPVKPARLVIPYPPGGLDITARLLMPAIEKDLAHL